MGKRYLGVIGLLVLPTLTACGPSDDEVREMVAAKVSEELTERAQEFVGPEGPQGPQGPPGSQGVPGPEPSEETLGALIESVVAERDTPWSQIADVPEGFADENDDDTLGGLVCAPEHTAYWDGTAWVCGDAGAILSILDAQSGSFGRVSSATGADGLGLISYHFRDELRVGHCEDVRCTRASLNSLDSPISPVAPSIAIGADGMGLISYIRRNAQSLGELRVAHCENASCSSSASTRVDSTSVDTQAGGSALAIGADGLGLISYVASDRSGSEERRILSVAHCENIGCTVATVSPVEPAIRGRVVARDMATGADGLGIFTYWVGGVGLVVAHCENVLCSSVTTSTLDGGTVNSPPSTSMAIGGDGKPLISYHDDRNYYVKVAHCEDVACTSSTVSILEPYSQGGFASISSITIGADGLGLIAYTVPTFSGLKVAHCENVGCTERITTVVGSYPVRYLDIAVGADGLGLVAYVRSGLDLLVVAHCANPVFCDP